MWFHSRRQFILLLLSFTIGLRASKGIMICSQQFVIVVAMFGNLAFTNSANTEDTFGIMEASDHQFPYMVSLRRTEYEMVLGNRTHICAGALIDENIVVTAAHCIFDMFGNYVGNKNSFIVIAGNKNASCNASIQRMAKRIYAYPGYIKSTGEDDLAIIVLNSGIRDDGATVSTIRLPTAPAESGDKCIVIGWNNYISNTISGTLQYYAVQLQSEEFCENSYKGKGTYLPGKQLCACPEDTQKDNNGCNYADICSKNDSNSQESSSVEKELTSLPSRVESNSGDYAGILVCNDKITGILASSNNCRDVMNRPQIFTAIREYVDFLHDPENYLPEMGSLLIHSETEYDDGDDTPGDATPDAACGERVKWNNVVIILWNVFFLIGNVITF